MIDENKLIEKIEELKSSLIHGACSSQVAMEVRCKEEAYDEVRAIIDSMQEEPVSKDYEKALNSEAVTFLQKQQVVPNFYACMIIDAVKHGAKWQKQRDNIPQELIDAYWEFQKIGGDSLSDFINAVNGYNAKKESVNDGLIEELKKIVNIRKCVSQGVPVIKIARHFANWKKQQMMKDAKDYDVMLDNRGFDCIYPDGVRYGDKVKLIIIKKD